MAQGKGRKDGAGRCSACESALCETLQVLRAQQGGDQDILGIEQAARLMRCSVDTLRRIPAGELPVYRIGRENLYLREEIIRFVRARPVQGANIDEVLGDVLDCVDELIPQVIDLDPVDVRRRSKRRAS